MGAAMRSAKSRNLGLLIPKLRSFVDDYRNKVGGLIIFANITPWCKEFLTENINELYIDPDACYYSEDTSGFSEKFYAVEPQGSDLIFTKNHYDLFSNEDFAKEMAKRKIRYFVITGISFRMTRWVFLHSHVYCVAETRSFYYLKNCKEVKRVIN